VNRLSSLICGLLFGAGLAASGMTNPAKVIGFLDLFGNWDPDLLFVMGSAVLTTVISFRFVLKRKTPLFHNVFSLPSSTVIDVKILLGAVLFGVGWGLYGYCPGPAVAAIVYLQPVTIVFLIPMLCGMFIGDGLSRRFSKN
jgi:uncharacterized membrane protein YedE/YeeE